MDIVVHTGCANPDTPNGLKRDLAWINFERDTHTTKKLFITIESPRSGFDVLAKYLPNFSLKHVHVIRYLLQNRQDLFASWTALGIDSNTVHDLTELERFWRHGQLEVYEMSARDEDVLDKLCLLAVWRFHQFTDSGWCTIGSSCRSPWDTMLIDDPSASGCYLGSLAKYDEGCGSPRDSATIVTHISDAFLLELLEDDRVAKRSSKLEEALRNEVEWLLGITETHVDNTGWDHWRHIDTTLEVWVCAIRRTLCAPSSTAECYKLHMGIHGVFVEGMLVRTWTSYCWRTLA